MAIAQIHVDPVLSKYPATKAGARLLNLQYFYTGKPCKNGHIGLRYTSSGNCVDCFATVRNKTAPSTAERRSHENSIRALNALSTGNTTYIPKTPCKQGHYLRYVGSNNCVTCNNLAEKMRSDAGYHRWARIKKEYGLTQEEFYALWERQGKKCMICENEILSESKCHIDHNHSTGKVRGILCGTCNQGLGLFKEDPALLHSAVRYLEEKNAT